MEGDVLAHEGENVATGNGGKDGVDEEMAGGVEVGSS